MNKALLFVAILLPKMYLMDIEVQKELGLVDPDTAMFELTITDSLTLIKTNENIVLIAERCDEYP